jgi:hypothetical protein
MQFPFIISPPSQLTSFGSSSIGSSSSSFFGGSSGSVSVLSLLVEVSSSPFVEGPPLVEGSLVLVPSSSVVVSLFSVVVVSSSSEFLYFSQEFVSLLNICPSGQVIFVSHDKVSIL